MDIFQDHQVMHEISFQDHQIKHDETQEDSIIEMDAINAIVNSKLEIA
jgi:hypothetical protein